MSWSVLTPLGNAVLVWPVALLAGVLLAGQGAEAGRAAWRWLLCFAAACALVAGSKIAFYGWGLGVRAWNLTCFSGHTVLALGTWPVVLAVLAPPRLRAWRVTLAALGVAVGLLVGWSRVELRAHPLSEVLTGVALGGLVAWVGLHRLRGVHLSLGKATLLAATLSALTLWGSSQLALRLPTEQWLRQIGTTLSGRDKPYIRRQWLRATQVPAPVKPISGYMRGTSKH